MFAHEMNESRVEWKRKERERKEEWERKLGAGGHEHGRGEREDDRGAERVELEWDDRVGTEVQEGVRQKSLLEQAVEREIGDNEYEDIDLI